jgi:membrane protein involved in colicin uptake
MSYNHISHAEDTEDIADSVNPSNYDTHHSKEWNLAVEKKAQELENEMKIEENMKISQKKAKEDAKKRAIEAKAKAEAEKRKKAQELADKNHHKTVV